MYAKTRFAPSPTGILHLGNARTALFNHLLARALHGALLLRVEDTDPERSREEYVAALVEDLTWLGLEWTEGEAAGGELGPYRQSARLDIYREHYRQLEAQGLAYPCFCSNEELSRVRKAQRAAGRAPRYPGTCARLSAEEVKAKLAAGGRPSLRFRVPAGRSVELDDLVRGRQVFRTNDIGDFIIRRSNGAPAFFFCNAVDDAMMGVTHVLRGEDHLTNTPRQLLLLGALGLPAPRYGHIALIVGDDGAPLSKRHGSRSLRALRREGYLPGAVCNYLARLGHNYTDHRFLDPKELASAFRIEALGRAPARHDPAQLLRWQGEALAAAGPQALWQWMGTEVQTLVPDRLRDAFIAAVRPNVQFPSQALDWARTLFEPLERFPEEAEAIVRAAGADFFRVAEQAMEAAGDDFKLLAAQVGLRAGVTGKRLFQPLRAALTGRLHGPEMGRLLPLLGPDEALRRLRSAASVCTAADTP
jgi:nondiscriminating glutamyl-tRNA synthetase